MKKMDLMQMENLQGGSNRQCMIDGGLTLAAMAIGGFGGIVGMSAAFIGGLGMANANGCFDR